MTSKFRRDGFGALPVEAIRNRRQISAAAASNHPAAGVPRRPELLYFFEG